MKRTQNGRRDFLKSSAATAAGLAVLSAFPRKVLGANDRLRVGLIGCGGRGNHLLGETFKSAGELNVEVAGLCDVWKVNLEKTAGRVAAQQNTKPRTFARFPDLLAMSDLDAVIIATPDFAHTPILIEATKLKKHAFVEKPMATVLEHANTAVKLVRENQTIVQVGTQRRSDQRHHAGAKLVQSGILGKVTEVETAWHDASPRWAREFNDIRREDVDWEQYLMFLPKEPWNPARFRRWHLYKDFTVGTPGLLGAHLIDVGLWFMDDPLPRSAVAHGGVYVWKDGREHADTLECALEYPKGFLLKYATRLGNNNPVPEAIFFGTKGTFDTETWTARGTGGGKDALAQSVTVPKLAAPVAAAPAGAGTQRGAAEEAGLAQPDPRIAGEGHVRNWLECVRSRKPPNAPIEVGYAHSVASIMCFKAWESGRRQVFDPVSQQIRPA
ncbi:MAG TPA: Gfo/Idh/MocA family oxidoreductase [Vicinamibacteria bacterium]|nr:Gfo/Idh/MocA family oxidoreductase [Vicinamibacteria bacterium]